jgi:hypothetical protein
MRKALVVLLGTFLLASPAALAKSSKSRSHSSKPKSSAGHGRTYVHGYTKRDGTVVSPHTRNAPHKKK